MKKLNPLKNNSELIEIETPQMADYEGISAEGYYGASRQGDERQMLRGFFSTLRKHWLLILCVNLLITAATIVYVAQKPDYYKATVRVQVNAENNPAAGGEDGKGGQIIVNNPGSDPGYFTTQLQILEGPGLLRRVAKTLDLENNQNFLNPQNGKRLTAWQNVGRMFDFYRPALASEQAPAAPVVRADGNKLNISGDKTLDPDAETEKYASIVGRMKNNLTVMPVKDYRTSNRETRLIEIEYTHGDPQIAAKIVNSIGDAYVLQNLEQKIQSNASAGDFLQKRVAELQADIRRGEERLINYSKNNQIVSLDPGQNTVVQRFSDLSMKLGQAENDRIAAQTAYQAAQQNAMRSATDESKDSQVVALENKLNDLRQRLAQLKTEYTDEWYEVVQTRKQIESIESQILPLRQRASGIQIATLSERLNEAIAREKELRANFDTQRDDVIKQNEAAINYRIIQQEIATNKSLLDGLLQRSRENDVILNGTPNNVLVTERAPVPRFAAGPDRLKDILIAFVISLFAGCGLAFLLDWLNDSLKNSDEIESVLGMPLLAAIPAAPKRLSRRLMPKLSRWNKTDKGFYNLPAFEKPEFSEAYLQLRTYLMLSSAGGAPQIILIASGEEGEGKTLTALNLANSLAKNGSKILLIDADLRCPRIHAIKELSNDYGLTTLLAAKELNDQTIEKVIQKSGDNLDILAAGERTANPANLLSSNEMRALLENLSARYTHIVIDSPPVLFFADGAILSTLADAVIIVVRDGVSSRQLVLKAKKMLLSVGAKVIGVVMNGIPVKWTNYSGYRKYELGGGQLPPENDYQLLKLH